MALNTHVQLSSLLRAQAQTKQDERRTHLPRFPLVQFTSGSSSRQDEHRTHLSTCLVCDLSSMSSRWSEAGPLVQLSSLPSSFRAQARMAMPSVTSMAQCRNKSRVLSSTRTHSDLISCTMSSSSNVGTNWQRQVGANPSKSTSYRARVRYI